MKTRHLLLAISITAIWGLNFSVIKLGLGTVEPLILAGLRFTLCALGLLGSVMIFDERLSLNKIVAVVLIVSGLGVGLYGQRMLGAVLKRIHRQPNQA